MKPEERTIIHFTKKFDKLKGIFNVGFKVKFCREEIMFRDEKKALRVPMVSFCDIPIREAGENMSKYGNYAIGLTEEWAIAKGLTPVIYLQSHSFLADSLLTVLNFLVGGFSQQLKDEITAHYTAETLPASTENFIKGGVLGMSDPNGDGLMASLDILRYTKNYVGELRRADGHFDPHYYFADEREWRYSLNTQNFSKFIYPDKVFENKGMAETIQALIADERLEFCPADVRYILIEKEDDRSEMEAHLKSLTERYNDADVADLCRKIFTIEQLTKSS